MCPNVSRQTILIAAMGNLPIKIQHHCDDGSRLLILSHCMMQLIGFFFSRGKCTLPANLPPEGTYSTKQTPAPHLSLPVFSGFFPNPFILFIQEATRDPKTTCAESCRHLLLHLSSRESAPIFYTTLNFLSVYLIQQLLVPSLDRHARLVRRSA